MHWVNVYCLISFAPVYWKTTITNTNVVGKVSNDRETRRILKQNKYEFQRITVTHSVYNCNCRLDFRRDRLSKNTPNGGYKDLEMCLRSIPAESFKNSQRTDSFFFSFIFLTKGIFLYASTIEKLAPGKL